MTAAEVKTQEKPLIWRNVIFIAYVQLGALLGFYFLLFQSSYYTWLWTYLLVLITSQGAGAGVHRLWAHRAYKAKLPMRIYLMLSHTIAFQRDLYDWCRDHRLHHKYSDTVYDPHNASRGFWYSHVGWLFAKKDKCLIEKGKQLDLSDLEADPVVMFQKKYYWILGPTMAFLFPALVPWYFWNERFHISWYGCTIVINFLNFHASSAVNSVAHIFGSKPYDKNILPTQNLGVSLFTNGEGFHNYHHAFPYDYKAAELGSYYGNFSTAFIDFCSWVGWAYDLKSVPRELVERKAKRSGDGSWEFVQNNTWGWGDKDMDKEEAAQIKSEF